MMRISTASLRSIVKSIKVEELNSRLSAREKLEEIPLELKPGSINDNQHDNDPAE